MEKFACDYKDDGSKSGRNSLRQPYPSATHHIKRQQYGLLRGDNKQNAFIQSITDNAAGDDNDGQYGSRSYIEYDNFAMTPTYRDISFEMNQVSF